MSHRTIRCQTFDSRLLRHLLRNRKAVGSNYMEKEVWALSGIVLGVVLKHFFDTRQQRHRDRKIHAEKVFDTLLPLDSMIGYFYAHGSYFPNSHGLRDAVQQASSAQLSAMKLGTKHYNMWNQAMANAHECYLKFRLHVSSEAVDDMELIGYSPDELVKDPEAFYRSVVHAQKAIRECITEMRGILAIK